MVIKDETIWATQKAMAQLFDVGVPDISKHLKKKYETGELDKNTTISKMETVVNRGFRREGVNETCPCDTLIDAARNVWRSNNVAGFTKGEAEEATRLMAEDYIVSTVVEETRQRNGGRGKSICFVTGVPGAGKTLVGLNVSVALQNVGASMLSGNGPLVSVLTAALKRDLNKYKKQLKTATNEISVESIIRGAYGYKKEIFEKRLDYHVGEGTVSLKDNPCSCLSLRL